jgi:hypothetical protein
MPVRSPLEQRIDAFMDTITDGFVPLFRAMRDGFEQLRGSLKPPPPGA